MMSVRRRKALGDWGEAKAAVLLAREGFTDIRNLNAERMNHPYADVFAWRQHTSYRNSVKNRNMFDRTGKLNGSYNLRKRQMDVRTLAKARRAVPAWLAIQARPEARTFTAYFGTMAQICRRGMRLSIPLTSPHIETYECLARDERDSSLRPDWTNRREGRLT
jgi:hypothetical protein